MEIFKKTPKIPPSQNPEPPKDAHAREIAELWTAIGDLRIQISKIHGRSGGRPPKTNDYGVLPEEVLSETDKYIVLRNGKIINK